VIDDNEPNEIPLNPPFTKGEFMQKGAFPLFEKEGSGALLSKII
jgi:hypothetical protein